MFQVTPSVSCCRIGGTAIILDIEDDRYFALPLPEEKQDHDIFEHSAIQRLCDRDGVEPNAVASEEKIVLPRASSLTSPELEPGACNARLDAIVCLTFAFYELRLRPLKTVLAHAEQRQLKLSRARRAGVRLSSVLRHFEEAQRFFPIVDRCLPQSLALQRYLARFGIPAALVFGVTWKPFAAHCWVQSDGELLTGPAEVIRGFSPIRIIS